LLSPTFHLPLLKSRNKRSIRQIWLFATGRDTFPPRSCDAARNGRQYRGARRHGRYRGRTYCPGTRARGLLNYWMCASCIACCPRRLRPRRTSSTRGRIHYGITRELRRAKGQRIGHLASTDQPQALSFYRRSRPTTYRNCKRPLMVISRRQVCSATSDYLLACMDECGVKRGFHESEHTDRLHPA
jgi:hypothetical protein